MHDTGKIHARIHTNTCWYVLNTYQYHRSVLGHVFLHVFRYVFACISFWSMPIHTKYASNTCTIRINTDWYVSIHTRHVSIHALNTYRNTYQNTYQYGAVVLVRICTYQVSIRALHFPDAAPAAVNVRRRQPRRTSSVACVRAWVLSFTTGWCRAALRTSRSRIVACSGNGSRGRDSRPKFWEPAS